MIVVEYSVDNSSHDQGIVAFIGFIGDLAINRYHCLDFVSLRQGHCEVAMVYWISAQDLMDWENDPAQFQFLDFYSNTYPTNSPSHDNKPVRWCDIYCQEAMELNNRFLPMVM